MSNPSPRILVVEDEPQIRRFVRMSLEAQGYEVHEAETLRRALGEAHSRVPDVIVLDLGLPDGNGTDFIRDLRSWSEVPVIVLSARTAEQDKVQALDMGADDYLTKPFGADELLARVRAQIRRRLRGSGGEHIIRFGTVTLDLERRIVERDGKAVHLTPIEYRLLAFLASNPDRVLTNQQLLKTVWGSAHAEDSHYVRSYVAFIRKKIEQDPAQPRHILTETGVGYRFTA